ncbi:MAG: Dam family site-specific DNA-(adenine-N6)-methyltransferase [Bacteroidetes bacterium]|nr:Dam family site-specific DNA-(adenine-N6)-methyltransferase [Bacteroidota bacterium]
MFSQEKIEPFIRWAGGKQRIVQKLLRFIPENIYELNYREPFVGAGSLFFALQPSQAWLSDANSHLINCFKHVRDYPDLINTYLKQHAAKTCKDYYYNIRQQYNRGYESTAQAARFIYLNKTCFNGIFRVNKNGQFNVPYGWKEPPALPQLHLLRQASVALKNAKLTALPFEKILLNISKNDFIYLDPPYPPLNGTSYFTHYTVERFCEKDQRKLANLAKQLDSFGCRFMMSNADVPLVRELYHQFNIFMFSVNRSISCKSKRHNVSELIITNYLPSGVDK